MRDAIISTTLVAHLKRLLLYAHKGIKLFLFSVITVFVVKRHLIRLCDGFVVNGFYFYNKKRIRAIREMQFICNHLAQKLGTTQFKQMNYEMLMLL